MREILFYRTESGSSPVEDFLDSLESKQAQKVAWVLQLIEELDVVPSQYFKKLVIVLPVKPSLLDFIFDSPGSPFNLMMKGSLLNTTAEFFLRSILAFAGLVYDKNLLSKSNTGIFLSDFSDISSSR